MKKLSYILLLFTSLAKAQVPQGINYQAVIRNASGVIVTGNVNIKFDLYNSATGTVIYSEEHLNVTTTTVGVATCTIGLGTPLLNTFSSVLWESGDVWYEVYAKVGTGIYSQIGTKQKFMTVPFAFYSDKANLANDVPATYNANVLTVGTNSFTLNNGTSYTAGNGIAINAGVIENTAPNKPLYFIQSSTSAFTIPSATLTAIPFYNLDASNVGTYLTPSAFTVPITGIYHIDASVLIDILAQLSILLNINFKL
jgi:hypothetical protein